MVDCGPLGYLSIAAHGHADALSFVLSAGGVELLIDPGTYAFHTEKRWRDYFRSTFAHNTVCVDGLNQSEMGGNFLWLRKASATCELAPTCGDMQKFAGWHDGYLHLKDPVTHRREISFISSSNCFEVVDQLLCKGRHQIEVCWHLAENCEVEVVDAKALITAGPVRLTISMQGAKFVPTLLHGQENPPAGWVSRAFDAKTPSSTLVWQGQIQGDTSLCTRLQLVFGV